jgi:hypothetical protein
MRSGRLSSTTDSPYSSSPSTQTAYSIANFVWKDEESNYAADPRTMPETIQGSRTANYFPKPEQQFPKENGTNFPHPEFKAPFPVRPSPQSFPTASKLIPINPFPNYAQPPMNPVIVAQPQPSRHPPPNLQLPPNLQKNNNSGPSFRAPPSPNGNMQSNHGNPFPSNSGASLNPVTLTVSTTTTSSPSTLTVPSSPLSTNSQQSSSQLSQTLCRYFANGYCNRGEKCFYSHDLSAAEPQQQQQPPQQPSSKANHSTPKKGTPVKTPTKQPPQSPMKSPMASSTHTRPLFPEPKSPTVTPIEPEPSPSPKQQQQPLQIPQPQPQTPTTQGTQGQVVPLSSSPPLNSEAFYANFDNVMGKIYLVSKDQQGCRFLQKKLEEKDAKVTQTIFSEVYQYVNELMTGIEPLLCFILIIHIRSFWKLFVSKIIRTL